MNRRTATAGGHCDGAGDRCQQDEGGQHPPQEVRGERNDADHKDVEHRDEGLEGSPGEEVLSPLPVEIEQRAHVDAQADEYESGQSGGGGAGAREQIAPPGGVVAGHRWPPTAAPASRALEGRGRTGAGRPERETMARKTLMPGLRFPSLATASPCPQPSAGAKATGLKLSARLGSGAGAARSGGQRAAPSGAQLVAAVICLAAGLAGIQHSADAGHRLTVSKSQQRIRGLRRVLPGHRHPGCDQPGDDGG